WLVLKLANLFIGLALFAGIVLAIVWGAQRLDLNPEIHREVWKATHNGAPLPIAPIMDRGPAPQPQVVETVVHPEPPQPAPTKTEPPLQPGPSTATAVDADHVRVKFTGYEAGGVGIMILGPG